MTDRYFENFMREETSTVEGADEEERSVGLHKESQDSLLKLLSMPYPTLSARLKSAAIDLKQTVVGKTWGFTLERNRRISDFTLYTGALGTAFLLFKSFQVTDNRNDLNLCSEIIKACDPASLHARAVTFICGRVGVCALGAVVAKHQANQQMLEYYLAEFKGIKVNEDHPDELLYGKLGFLWACLFLNKNLGDGVIPSTFTRALVNKVIKNGRKLGVGSRCPLMFKWFGQRFWGAAHGLAGNMYVLMHFDLPSDVVEDIKKTLKYMIENRFPSGNYPSSEEENTSDLLVHWCHGAPGMALTLVKAAEIFDDKEFLEAAIDAAEVVWKRGLLKRVGLCHGISGNAYVFLSLFRLTGNVEFLYRAKAFACFLLDRAGKLISEGEMHGGDNRYSLFEGVGGMAYLFLDMIDPANARFPGHEL
ncbi:lanC-like protein GCL2 [Cynara cardunculus var. scolymus]|uniref:lanC-like protein GCL2 n=1 Tax=Cynara cardunculus var. scolymus TaxID=59895 RepID=UPI000D630354|nr:lanC-like protein GCL2 [Cynara cardunculus var. scolymus]